MKEDDTVQNYVAQQHKQFLPTVKKDLTNSVLTKIVKL